MYRCEFFGCTFETSNARAFMQHGRLRGHIPGTPDLRDTMPLQEKYNQHLSTILDAQRLAPGKKISLAKAVRQKRGKQSYRVVAKQLGIPHATLQFIEDGRLPGPVVFIRLLRWLEVIDQSTADRLLSYVD